MVPRTSLLLFTDKIQAWVQHTLTCASRPQRQYVLAKVSGRGVRWKRSMLFLCRLYSWTESKFTIRGYFAKAVPGLIVSDVNFSFSWFVHNHGFCFLQVWCPTVFVSSGRRVLFKFGPQDNLSYKVLKKMCNTDRMACGMNCLVFTCCLMTCYDLCVSLDVTYQEWKSAPPSTPPILAHTHSSSPFPNINEPFSFNSICLPPRYLRFSRTDGLSADSTV